MSDVNDSLESNDGIHLDAVIGFLQGQKKERERIINLAKKRICFNNEVGCEHSACYSLSQLIEKIEEKQDE